MTIPEGFRRQAEQAKLNAPLKTKHADVRAQIIRCISSLPGAPTALVLTGLSSIKLAQEALKWFTAENPHGIFGSEDNLVHVEQLLLERVFSFSFCAFVLRVKRVADSDLVPLYSQSSFFARKSLDRSD
jgi:hypothetical protein